MKMPICSVRDKLIGFGSPFTSVNESVAIRGFANSILGGDYPDSVNPEDLSLYVCGEFDSENGVISVCEPHAIAYGHAIITESFKHHVCCDCSSGGDIDGMQDE